MIDKVLIISNGINGDQITMHGIETDTLGIFEIKQRYRVVILEWCGFASTEKVSDTSHKVETDIGKVIEAIQQQFKILGNDETVPLIISSNLHTGDYPRTNDTGVEFLVRRILSENEDHNRRRLAIVTEGRRKIGRSLTDIMDEVGDNYELIIKNQRSFLDTLGSGETYDGIMLPETSKYKWPVNNTNPDYPIAWTPRKFNNDSVREIVLSDEVELGDLGFDNYWDIVEKFKTVRCGELWGYRSKQPKKHHIEGFSMHNFPKFDIPSLLKRCPRV